MTRSKWQLTEMDEFDVACQDWPHTRQGRAYQRGFEKGKAVGFNLAVSLYAERFGC